MSVQEFLTMFRISRAKELLSTTTLSIEHVAASCGYQNTLVFSKAFKRNMGCTPTVYRYEHRKTAQEHLDKNNDLLEKLMEDDSLRKLKQR